MKINALYLILLLALNSCAQKNNTIKNETAMNTMNLSEKEWKEKLTEEQYYILREKGTERPFTGKLLMNKEKGVYKCAGCGNELFTDEMKFDSHCGWPSFDKEIAGGKIKQIKDNSHGMIRTEIVCANCNGHLGHIFDDGPTDTGMRYCVNSLSLEFEKITNLKNDKMENITLGGGCFWCVESIYNMLNGVEKAVSGYSGGTTINPTYKEICTGTTNHAEVVRITFDPKIITVTEILEVFFTAHNPTTLNRQGEDIGTQYRSVIFYENENQKKIAQEIIKKLSEEKIYNNPIVTQIESFTKFYPAEDYHQDYYNQNKEQPYCNIVITPKIEKFKKVFKDKMKKSK
jgi:peptide methionine sulfoxide reductase msrA/msrB